MISFGFWFAVGVAIWFCTLCGFGWMCCGVWCGVVPLGLSFCFLSCVAGFCCLLWGCAVFVASGGYGLWIL